MPTQTETDDSEERTDRVTSTCFGFEVETSLPFRFLRPGSAGSSLRISEIADVAPPPDEPVRRWLPSPGHPFEAALYRDDGGFKFWAKGPGWYVIDPLAPSIMIPRDADPLSREERAWGFPIALCFIARGDLPVHAAAVEIDGRAIVLAAPGRYGKTTLAASFLRRGHRLLSEDITCCRLADPPVVLPGPAMLRVRHDVYERLHLPSTSVVRSDEERVHLALEDGIRGDGEPVPISAIVLLRKEEGPASIARVEPTDALQDLWALSFKLPTDADRARSFAGIARAADRIPIWNLRRSLRYEELDHVIDLVIEHCSAG